MKIEIVDKGLEDTALPPDVQRERDENQRAANLRDWFTGQALVGLVADGGYADKSEAARDAYEHADAMLRARVTQ